MSPSLQPSPGWPAPRHAAGADHQSAQDRKTGGERGAGHFYPISFHNGFGNQGLGRSWLPGAFGGHTRIESTGFSRDLLSGGRVGGSGEGPRPSPGSADAQARCLPGVGSEGGSLLRVADVALQPPQLCHVWLSPRTGHVISQASAFLSGGVTRAPPRQQHVVRIKETRPGAWATCRP